MCPFCLASIGLTALAMKLSQQKNMGQEVAPNSSESSMTGEDRRIGLAGIACEQADAR